LFDLIGVQQALILGNPNYVNRELVMRARWDSPAIEDLGEQIATNIWECGVLYRLPELACLGRQPLVPLREERGFQIPQPGHRSHVSATYRLDIEKPCGARRDVAPVAAGGVFGNDRQSNLVSGKNASTRERSSSFSRRRLECDCPRSASSSEVA
jgi:hypothetical protein